MPILRNLRAKRLELTVKSGRKVTAGEIAAQIGMTRSHYCNVEGGAAPGSEEMAHLLASVFGCEAAELLPLESKKKPTPPPKQPQPKTTGPRKREESDTKSPGRAQQQQAGAA